MNRLSEGDLVVITPPRDDPRRRSGGLACYVVAIADGVAALEPTRRSDARRLPDSVDDAFMSFRHGSALVGLRGVLYRLAPDDLRFRVSDGVHMPRRQATRVEVCAPVTVRCLDSEAEPAESFTVDLSVDGLLAETDIETAVGDRLQVSFGLPGLDSDIAAEGRVVRASSGLVAVAFDRIDRRDRGRIGAFVFEANRDLHRRRTAADVVVDDLIF